MLNSCFYIFANAIIFLSSIKSIISIVESDKNRQICRFLAERQIGIRDYDMVLLGLMLNITILQWWGKCSLLSKIKHLSQRISYHSSIVCILRTSIWSCGSLSEQKEGSPQSFKYWQYHFMNKNMEYYW